MRLLEKAMLKAVADTFENLAFIEVIPAEEESLGNTEKPVIAMLLCHEPLQGEIRAAFPKELVTEVAATVFGFQEKECSEATMQDVSAEILNTIAGRFLSELLPEHQAFRIGLPEIAEQQVIEENEGWQEWFFKASEYSFRVSLLNLTPPNLMVGDKFVADSF